MYKLIILLAAVLVLFSCQNRNEQMNIDQNVHILDSFNVKKYELNIRLLNDTMNSIPKILGAMVSNMTNDTVYLKLCKKNTLPITEIHCRDIKEIGGWRFGSPFNFCFDTLKLIPGENQFVKLHIELNDNITDSVKFNVSFFNINTHEGSRITQTHRFVFRKNKFVEIFQPGGFGSFDKE